MKGGDIMRVFASRFLEKPSSECSLSVKDWGWKPENPDATQVYGSGANTQTRASTYAAEKDNRDDDDRPNEGLFVA